MLFMNLGWSTDDIWMFTMPTASQPYCVVLENTIIEYWEKVIPEEGSDPSIVYDWEQMTY